MECYLCHRIQRNYDICQHCHLYFFKNLISFNNKKNQAYQYYDIMFDYCDNIWNKKSIEFDITKDHITQFIHNMRIINIPIYSKVDTLNFIRSYLQGRRNLTWFKREKHIQNLQYIDLIYKLDLPTDMCWIIYHFAKN